MVEKNLPNSIYLTLDNTEFTKPLKDTSKWIVYHREGRLSELEEYEKLVEFIETKLMAGLFREPRTDDKEIIGVMRRVGEVLQKIYSFKKRIKND